jgi:hypothetical protein
LEGGSAAAIGRRLGVMTGANGGANPGGLLEWRWGVALSSAGAQWNYVEQVAEALKARGPLLL